MLLAASLSLLPLAILGRANQARVGFMRAHPHRGDLLFHLRIGSELIIAYDGWGRDLGRSGGDLLFHLRIDSSSWGSSSLFFVTNGERCVGGGGGEGGGVWEEDSESETPNERSLFYSF